MGNTPSNSDNQGNYIKTTMTKMEYDEYQKYLIQKKSQTPLPKVQKPLPKVQKPLEKKIKTPVFKKTDSSRNKEDILAQLFGESKTKQQTISNLPNSNQTHRIIPKISQLNDHSLNQKYSELANNRIYQKPNAPFHPQPRMKMNLQISKKETHLKDKYENIFQQRQIETNHHYLKSKLENQQQLNTQQSNQSQSTQQSNQPSITDNLNLFSKHHNPYQLLGVQLDTPLREITRSYRKLAKKTHPDRGGDPIIFDRLTKAYLVILEIKKQSEPQKNHQSLKKDFGDIDNNISNQKPTFCQSNESFNLQGFNRFFNENHIGDVYDAGYGKWIEDNQINNAKIEKKFSDKFNLSVFNSAFDDMKESYVTTKDIIVSDNPEAAFMGTKINCVELGQDQISDFSQNNHLDNSKLLNYTDYQKAMTSSLLIQPKHSRKNYQNLEELQTERDEQDFTPSDVEMQRYKDNISELQKLEQKRLLRLNQRDKQITSQHQKITQLLGSN